MKTINTIDQLTEAYLLKQQAHTNKLSLEQAHTYFTQLLTQGNIVVYELNGRLIGYCEYWILNYEQLGRVVCREPFSAIHENIVDGPVCFIADLWIDEDFAHTDIIVYLKNNIKLLNLGTDRKYFVGDRLKNNNRSIHIQKIREV